jgi:hypothetical protein
MWKIEIEVWKIKIRKLKGMKSKNMEKYENKK